MENSFTENKQINQNETFCSSQSPSDAKKKTTNKQPKRLGSKLFTIKHTSLFTLRLEGVIKLVRNWESVSDVRSVQFAPSTSDSDSSLVSD